MYKCRYTFWDEKNFPGFTKALSDLYDRSIEKYFSENHDSKDHRRDLEAIYNIFPLIEYYYVSLIKLGYVDKKNYFNILNQLKDIESVGVLKPGPVRGLTVGKSIQVNPVQEPFNELSGDDLFKLTVFHELGHIINLSWEKEYHELSERLFNNREIRERLNKFGINSKNDLINGFILLEDVIVEEAAEDVLYRSKEEPRPPFMKYRSNIFPGVEYRSNYCMYTNFQELGLKFFRSFNFIDCFREKTVSSALKKSSTKAFNREFMTRMTDEICTDINKMSDFALILGCLGKVKNANYSDFGLAVKDDKRNNTYYYNLYLSLINDKIIRLVDEKKNNY